MPSLEVGFGGLHENFQPSIVSPGMQKPIYVHQETKEHSGPSKSDLSATTDTSSNDDPKVNVDPAHSSIPHAENEEKPWRCGEPYHYPLPKDGDPWEKCLMMAKESDKSMCENWTDEVQNLLIFAGLFSAVVTTFAVDSYKLLQENPPDTSTQLLAEILAQLTISNNQNVTLPPSASSNSVSTPPSSSAVRVNIFWFISLVLSLTVVLIGILCLQWLREFRRYDALPPKDALALRQMRHDGLVKWHVPTILSALPLLLQTALILFFAGVLELLMTLNATVAIVMAVLVGFIAMFIVATTVLPSMQVIICAGKMGMVDQCPYKSPQSWAFYRLGLSIYSLAHRASCFQEVNMSLWLVKRSKSGWFGFDSVWRRVRENTHASRDLARAVAWSGQRFKQSLDSLFAIYHCLKELEDISAAGAALGLSSVQTMGKDAILDILLARSLDEFLAEKYWRQSSLMLLRLELYVRLKNVRVHSTYIKNMYPGRALYYWPNIPPLWSPEDIDIPEELRLQLLDCITKSFDKGTNLVHDAVDSFSIQAPWVLFATLLKEHNPSQRLCHSWQRFFTSQEDWLRGYEPDSYSQDHARQIIEGMWDNIVTRPTVFLRISKSAAVSSHLYDTFNSLCSFVRCLDNAIYGTPPYWPQFQLPEYVWRNFVSSLAVARQTLRIQDPAVD